MKKLLAIPLLFITSTLFAEANITINPRTLLRSTNTWTAAQNFSSATFTTIKVDNCDGCGTGGGGGGGSGAALFNGVNQTISVSTFGFPGASITSSQGFSTVTWNPAINSTYTQALVHDSTAQVKIHNINLTTGTAFSTFSGFLSTAGTTAETFKTWFASHSLYDVALATTINQNKADINNSTNTYQSFDNIRASTFAVQIDSISTAIGGIAPSTRAAVSQLSVSISTTQDVIKSTAAGLSTIGTINTADNPVDWSRLKNVPAGFADGTDDGGGGGITTDQANALILSTFNALTATAAYTTNQFTAAFSSIGALGASTQAIQSFFTGFMSTSDARGNTFVNFNTTGDVRLQNVQVATGTLATTFSGFLSTTSQRLQDVQVSTGTLASTFSGFLTTGDVRLQNVQVSTGTLASTFSTFITTANDVMRSTMSELADNTNTINTATNLVSWNSLKDVPAGFADGSDATGGGGGGETFGYVSTRTIDMNGYSITRATGLAIGATEFALLTITSITHTGVNPHYILVTSGTVGNETEKLLQLTKSSFTVNASTTYINGTLVLGGPDVRDDTYLEAQSGVFSKSLTAGGFSLTNGTWPYIREQMGAGTWVGIGVARANEGNGGYAVSSAPVAYDKMPTVYTEFKNSTRTYAFRTWTTPTSWVKGSTLGFQWNWFAGSGTANNNARIGMMAVALSSGDAMFPVITSSSCINTTYKAINQKVVTSTDTYDGINVSSFTIEGNPEPGEEVGLIAFRVGDDGRDTLESFLWMTNIDIYWRKQSLGDR